MLKLVMASYYGNTEILIHEDFMTEEQAEYLISVAENQAKSKWTMDLIESQEGDNYDFWNGKSVFLEHIDGLDINVIIDLETRARIIYESFYPELADKVRQSSIFCINKFKAGDSMPVHTDRGPNPNNNDIVHGMVIYLNDNYEGGEIHYPEQQLSIKPKARSLVIHPATHPYDHGVLPVIRGSRYALTLFVHERKNKKPN